MPSEDRPDWWSSDQWATPQPFIDALIARHGPFTLDVCARADTAKAPRCYTIADDGLHCAWYGRVWCNPPYSNPRPWIEKAITSTRVPHRTRVTMLLPAATDTAWFHDLVLPHASVELLRGRLKFLGWDGKPMGSPKGGNILAYFPHGWATL